MLLLVKWEEGRRASFGKWGQMDMFGPRCHPNVVIRDLTESNYFETGVGRTPNSVIQTNKCLLCPMVGPAPIYCCQPGLLKHVAGIFA